MAEFVGSVSEFRQFGRPPLTARRYSAVMPTSKDEISAEIFRFDQSDALLRKVMGSAAVGMILVGADGRTI